MTREELKRIVEYINNDIKEYITTDCYLTNNAIQDGFFNEEEFIEHGIVELDN